MSAPAKEEDGKKEEFREAIVTIEWLSFMSDE